MSLWPWMAVALAAVTGIVVVSRMRTRALVVARLTPTGDTDEPSAPRGALDAQERAAVWPWVTGAVAVPVLLLLGAPLLLTAAGAALVCALAHLVAGMLRSRSRVLLEAQLADAIDLMVGALHAGAGFPEALAAAAREARPPLRPVLAEVELRLRLGEGSRDVLEELSRHRGLESFRLFAVTLAVHAEVGGSLAPTLAGVARAVRDRVEVARQINVQTAEARFSVIAVLCLAYAIGLLSWRRDPDAMVAFLTSGTGGAVAAGVVATQAAGLVWIARLLRVKGA